MNHKHHQLGIFNEQSFLLFLEYFRSLSISPQLYNKCYLSYLILYGTGIRVNELRFFTGKTINELFAGHLVDLSIITKTGYEPRQLLLSAKYKKFLYYECHNLHQIMTFTKLDQPLLYSSRNPNSDTHSSAYVIRLLNGYLRQYSYAYPVYTRDHNLVVYRSHSFRHSFIQRLSSAGIDLDRIAKVVGHRSIQTTARYNLRQLSKSELSKIVNKI